MQGANGKKPRVTFDQVDRALAQVPYLVPKLRYWGVCYVIELSDDEKTGTVLHKTEDRDYRSALRFALEWIAEGNLERRLKGSGTPPAAVTATVNSARNHISGELYGKQ
jgi:hypothetical protein